MPDFAVRTAFTATDRLSPAFRNMSNSALGFGRTTETVFSRIKTIAAGVTLGNMFERAIYSVGNFINSSVESVRSLERIKVSFKSIFGGDSANQIKFVSEESERLGINFEKSAMAYRGLAAAAKGTAITNETVKESFLGVAEASAALQLTGEQTEGALLAISQIVSKGKVSMEELRGQLSERIPGAMQIASRAMGVTSAQFEQLVSKGLSAEVFLPRFAAQMRKEFGTAAAESAKSFNASMEKFDNLIFRLKTGIGGLLIPAINSLLSVIIPVIDSISIFISENNVLISAIISGLIPALYIAGGLFLAYKAAIFVAWIWQKAIAVETFLTNLALALQDPILKKSIARYGLFTALLKGSTIWTAALAAKTFLLAIATNLAAAPITLFILGLVALSALIVSAIKYWDKFGAAMMIALGPIGMMIATFKSLYDHWNKITDAFQNGGILSGIMEIGKAIADGLLYPIQQLLELIAKLSGPDSLAARGAASIKNFREGTLNAPNKADAESRGTKIGLTVNNNGTEASVESTPKGIVKPDLTQMGLNYAGGF